MVLKTSILLSLVATAVTANTACVKVSVKGDATYCIAGPVCSGALSTGACPTAGATPQSDCVPGIFSWNATTSACALPRSAVCGNINPPGGPTVYGCILPTTVATKALHKSIVAESDRVDEALLQVAPLTKPCTDVSVQGDATYCIVGHVCGGKTADGACPRYGAKASANCVPGIPSYLSSGKCQLKRSTRCMLVDAKTKTYGCALSQWPLEGDAAGPLEGGAGPSSSSLSSSSEVVTAIVQSAETTASGASGVTTNVAAMAMACVALVVAIAAAVVAVKSTQTQATTSALEGMAPVLVDDEAKEDVGEC